MVGETPMLAVASQRSATGLQVSIGGLKCLMAWPRDQSELFITLGSLAVGTYDLSVTLLDGDARLAEGAFTVVVRGLSPTARARQAREAIVAVTSPLQPTLGELWNDQVELEVVGPEGLEVEIAVVLLGPRSRTIAKRTFQMSLPVVARSWSMQFDREVRGDDAIAGAWDRAEACEISIRHAEVGSATVRWMKSKTIPSGVKKRTAVTPGSPPITASPSTRATTSSADSKERSTAALPWVREEMSRAKVAPRASGATEL